MKTRNWIVPVAALALLACDPYAEENTAAPEIVSVLASGIEPVSEVLTPIEGSPAGGRWVISGADLYQVAVWVIMNKQLDGASVEEPKDPNNPGAIPDCQPAGGWLTATATPALPNTCPGGTPETWYTCYYPSSSQPSEGGSVVIFKSCDPVDANTGFYEVGATLDPATTYTFDGSVKDAQGASVAIAVTMDTLLSAAAPTFGIVTAATVEVNWDAGGGTTFDVERAPNVPGTPPAPDSPGTFAAVAGCTNLTATTCTDVGVATATKYWYRVVRKGAANGVPDRAGDPDSVTTP